MEEIMRSLALVTMMSCGCATATAVVGNPDRAALMAADREFDAETAARGVDGWVSWFAPNGSMLLGEGPPIVGHDAIRAAMTPAFARSSLRWQPERAESLIPGALGVTTGSFVSTTVDDSGVSKQSTGHYISVWKKLADGAWRVVFDTGVPDPG
jgi:ketosteroid isomerase-like protein